jgi:uncharacterized protein (DUF885 family)
MSGRGGSGGRAATGFRSFLTQDWTRWIAENPELGTSFGIPGFNDQWTDDSAVGIERRNKHLAESIGRLGEIDRSCLERHDQLNYDLYQRGLAIAEEGVRLGYESLPFDLGEPHDRRMPMNQLEGVHITAADMLDLAPRDHLSDFEDRLTRLRSLPRLIDQQRALLAKGLAAGFTPPQVAIAGLPDQVRNLLADDPSRSALLAPFLDFPSWVGPADRTRLLAEARRAYVDGVAPAFQALLAYLTSEYLPHCRSSVGVSALSEGAVNYTYLVRRMTTTRLSPHEIHEIGQREVRRLRDEMAAVMAQVKFTGSFAQFKEFLRSDPQFYWAREEDLVNGYRIIGKKIDPQLGRLFGRLPRLPYGILPVPKFREQTSPAAYYVQGAPSTGRAGIFYASTYQVGIRPRWEMEALTLHEAVPGHHLQIALAQELDDLPEFRRATGPTAFIEGWGLYAESLGTELGFYEDPYSKFGQLMFDAWRSIRLVVDTGLHAMGWTRDQAIQFFRENTGMSDVGIAVEVDRYIVWPGQALAYKIGQMKIREMRSLAESRLGARFDVRAFHDLVLGNGAVPLAELETQARHWIDGQAVAPP